MTDPLPKQTESAPEPPEGLPGKEPIRTSVVVGLPLVAGLVIGIAAGWVHPGFAVVLGVVLLGHFAWWQRRRNHAIRKHYADLRTQDLRRALRSQRLALGISVVDGLPDPLLILNKKREVTLANRAARELFGRAVAGRDLAFALRQPQILAIVDKALKAANPGETEVSLLAPVSRDFHALVAPLLSPEEDGEIVSFDSLSAEQPAVALSLHEITDIRRAESMRADFVANASHELKTPLSNLVGFIETLQGPAHDDADARERFLSIMQAEASRMSRLINDLLSLSRIELDEHMRPQESVDLVALLEGVVNMMEMRAGKHSIRLALDSAPELRAVQGDSDQLVQVFQNLIDNAIKYSSEDSEIRISLTPVSRLPQGTLPGVMVAISDEGEGIPAEHIPRLTERFYRVDTGRSRQLGGTGLGLAIVKHITRRHRGWLDVKSEVGKGTTITVGLPFTKEDAPREAAR